jgi:hypothetical protein
MDISGFLDSIVKIFQLLTTTPTTTLLLIFGFGLIVVAGILAYWAPQRTAPLLISLVAGILFCAFGGGMALLKVEQKTIQKMETEQALKNLENNAEVHYVIRLIGYDPSEEAGLAIDRLTNLGPPDQLYSFVASYDELVGYKVIDALAKVGQRKDVKRVSAVIFPLHTPIFPANARGLLQVIQEVETRKAIQTQLKQKLVDGTGALIGDQAKDLKALDIPSYRLASFKDNYLHYCELAREFHCTAGYSAQAYVGALTKDWHPLGFSQKDPPDDRCRLSVPTYCEFSDWKKAKEEYSGHFGSRAFLIRNLEIKNIPGRIMIDFDKPSEQLIPDIGAR